MVMKFRAHDTFFIRKGWLSKGMKYVHAKDDVFISKNENPMDVLGIGANMVKALRYWLQAVGLTEEPSSGRRTQSFTPLGEIVFTNDRYIEEKGTLYLLQYRLASNRTDATSWYFFFNEFNMSEFSRDDFVAALQRFIQMSDESDAIAIRSLNDDFSCIINTYMPRYKVNPNHISPEGNIDCPFGELSLIDMLSKERKTYRKAIPSAKSINPWVALAVIADQAEAKEEVSLNELLTAPCNIGRVFNLDAITLLDVLYQIEKIGEIKINRTAGLDVIQLLHKPSSEKILPVVITGSSTSLTQAFIIALQRTLSDNGLLDIMPETNYRAAIAVIDRWKSEFPQTYKLFCNAIDKPVGVFLDELASFNISAYEAFERIYPSLTAGSTFNPFLGFDVVDLYESVAKSLKEYGYTGLYVVYDEFSKYLEANIKEASVSDTKTLQDFAEKCNRSGSMQLHLMLISHKEISNYIDTLPKQKVDGWRGVSERFKHIHLNNNFSQTYEIIASVIQKEPTKWARFQKNHQKDLEELLGRYKNHPLFSANSTELETAIMGCYPLHPVSTFILPRLSERVAQNERTLFTFLSAEGTSTLRSFIDVYDDDSFNLITPDEI